MVGGGGGGGGGGWWGGEGGARNLRPGRAGCAPWGCGGREGGSRRAELGGRVPGRPAARGRRLGRLKPAAAREVAPAGFGKGLSPLPGRRRRRSEAGVPVPVSSRYAVPAAGWREQKKPPARWSGGGRPGVSPAAGRSGGSGVGVSPGPAAARRAGTVLGRGGTRGQRGRRDGKQRARRAGASHSFTCCHTLAWGT